MMLQSVTIPYRQLQTICGIIETQAGKMAPEPVKSFNGILD